MIEIWCDGAYSHGEDLGGYGALILWNGRKKEISGLVSGATNNRMELIAAISGLQFLPKPCTIKLYSDSLYLVGTMKNNWKKKKNLDLWKVLEELNNFHKIEWIKVKGHSGIPNNERSDFLAASEIKKALKS
jgi:ribonuclease HI